MNGIVIGDHNFDQHLEAPEGRKKGLIPRDFDKHPVGSYANVPAMHAVEVPLIDQASWADILKDRTASKSLLSDVRKTGNNGGCIDALDQDGVGYCWAHSSTGAVMILRAIANAPYVPLSAFAVAATIKNGRDEGGWGAQSLDFIVERGVPAQSFWPQQSRDLSHGNAACWENAKLHKVTQGFIDLQAAQYDRNLTFAQVATLLLSGIPVIGDFNWWGHSVCLLDLVNGVSQRMETRADSGKLATVNEFEKIWGVNDPATGGFGVNILNSWSNSWSNNGEGVLTGSKAIPDGATAPRFSVPSVA